MEQVARNTPEVRSPERRLLRTFAFDPMSTRLSGRFLTVDVPFEHNLQAGPIGDLVHVVDFDATREVWYQPVDLDDPSILAQGGLQPSEGDPRTHQQVVYAVSMSVIERVERFIGRRFRWSSSRGNRALRMVPHAFEGRNAYFDPGRRAVLFGYFRADKRDPGPNLPGQMIFTCLSMDITAHEVTHAIAHRLRRYFAEATNPDVFAWHEAIADLVALFHHFTYPDVVADAVAAAQTDLREGGGLLDLAREFGESTGRGAALRSAIDAERTPDRFMAATEPHERGACFVAAVFDAFLDTYQARIEDLLRIATGGSGVLPPGRLHPDLVARVAEEAVKNADRFLGMVVRAFDYLPVVDVTFGDVVRAIVTADRSLYPDDAHQLRSSLVEALRRRGIYPSLVASLTDEALAWPRPEDLTLRDSTPPIDLSGVILSTTQDLDPTGQAGTISSDTSSDTEELEPASPAVTDAGTEAQIAPQLVAWARSHAVELGLDPDPGLSIALQGIHVAYRQAADRQPRPEVILQFIQRRRDLEDSSQSEQLRVAMRAGTTVIAGVDGTVDYLVPKPFPLTNPDALPADIAQAGRRFHEAGEERLKSIRDWLGQLDDADALNAWTVQPSARRLTFANLHAGRSGGQD
jgi:hypothetical protein